MIRDYNTYYNVLPFNNIDLIITLINVKREEEFGSPALTVYCFKCRVDEEKSSFELNVFRLEY